MAGIAVGNINGIWVGTGKGVTLDASDGARGYGVFPGPGVFRDLRRGGEGGGVGTLDEEGMTGTSITGSSPWSEFS